MSMNSAQPDIATSVSSSKMQMSAPTPRAGKTPKGVPTPKAGKTPSSKTPKATTTPSAAMKTPKGKTPKAIAVATESPGMSPKKGSPSAAAPTHGGLGAISAFWNLTSSLLGANLLTLPYAIHLLGFVSAALLIVMAAFMTFTAILLGKCAIRAAQKLDLASGKQAIDWPTIGLAAMGQQGERLVRGIMAGELLLVMITYAVMNGSILHVLLPFVSKRDLLCASGVISFLLARCPPRALSFSSALGIIALLLVVCSVALTGVVMPEKAPAKELEVASFASLPVVMGDLLFSFASHATVPSICSSMERPQRFAHTAIASFLVSLTVSVFLGVMSYSLFGAAVQENILDNVGKDLDLVPLEGLGALPAIGSAAFALKVQLTIPLFLSPMVNTVMELAGRFGGIPRSSPRVRLAVECGLLTLVVLLAIILQDNVFRCADLVGSSFIVCTAVIFPALFYVRLHDDGELSSCTKASLLGLCIIGTFFMFASTARVLREILESVSA